MSTASCDAPSFRALHSSDCHHTGCACQWQCIFTAHVWTLKMAVIMHASLPQRPCQDSC